MTRSRTESLAYRVPVMRPKGPPSEYLFPRLRTVLSRRSFSNFGPESRDFERRIASLIGVAPEQVVAVSSATAGISLAAQTLGGDSWVCPAWTFSATPAALLAAGKEVFFADVSPTTQALTSTTIEEAESVVLVAPFGAPIQENVLAGSQRVIVDAAASLGDAIVNGVSPPENSVFVFSVHATKVLGSGEGGLMICGTPELAAEARSRANFGFDLNRTSIEVGVNAKLSEYGAAVANAALDNWENELAEWLEARALVNGLSSTFGLTQFPGNLELVSPYWIVLLENQFERERLEKIFLQEKIETRRWWRDGCKAMPAYSSVESANLRSTHRLASRILGLPFYRDMNRKDILAISDALELFTEGDRFAKPEQ